MLLILYCSDILNSNHDTRNHFNMFDCSSPKRAPQRTKPTGAKMDEEAGAGLLS